MWVNFRSKSKSDPNKEYRAIKGTGSGTIIYWTKNANDPNIVKWESEGKAKLVAFRINRNDEWGYRWEEVPDEC